MEITTIINKLLEDINVLEGKKKDLIVKAAEDLEKAGMEPNKICLKLSEVLEGKTSAAYIREILPEKYKQASKVRTPPIKILTNGTQELEEIPIIEFKKDSINLDYLKSDGEWEQKTPQHEDRFKAIEGKLKEFESKYDNMVKIKDERINELEGIVKEKDKEITALKGKLATQPIITQTKKIEPFNRQVTIAAPSLFSNKTHDEYDRNKYSLKKPKT